VVSISERGYMLPAERQRHDAWKAADIALMGPDKYLCTLSHYPPGNSEMAAWLGQHEFGFAQ